MRLRRARWLALALLHALPAHSQGQDWGEGGQTGTEQPGPRPPVPQRSFADDPLHVMATVGFGTLVGFCGLTTGYNVHDRLELGAGFGVNASGAMGGPYLRVRPGVWTRQKSRTLHAVALDAGLSIGGYSYQRDPMSGLMGHSSSSDYPLYHADLAYFLQLEVSWEMVKLEGFSLRAGPGASVLLNPNDVTCEPAASAESAVAGCGAPPAFFPVMLFQFGTTI